MKKKDKVTVDFLLRKPVTSWEKFHKKTKVKKFTNSWISKGIPREWKDIQFKAYPRLKAVKLPLPNLSEKYSLKKL